MSAPDSQALSEYFNEDRNSDTTGTSDSEDEDEDSIDSIDSEDGTVDPHKNKLSNNSFTFVWILIGFGGICVCMFLALCLGLV